jgi:hypothetical protein
MKQNHRIYTELSYQLRRREDLRSAEEITLIAVKGRKATC